MSRPDFIKIESGEEFNDWYWTKEEMLAFCKSSNLPSDGSKFALRDRIMYALDNEGAIKPDQKKKKPTSKFNWTKESLTPETPITDNISFGNNLREFMVGQIGSHFSFNIAFMDWAKHSSGKSLKEAVIKWQALEDLKKDKGNKTHIPPHNMLNQYVRDFLDDNPASSFGVAKKAWSLKRKLPMKDGFVKYEKSDLSLG